MIVTTSVVYMIERLRIVVTIFKHWLYVGQYLILYVSFSSI